MKKETIPSHKEVTNNRDMIENETIRAGNASILSAWLRRIGKRRMRLE
jgi:hypothetical protein